MKTAIITGSAGLIGSESVRFFAEKGLVVDEEKFLHVEHGINTCLQKMKDFRIEGIFRYVGK